MVCGKDGIAIDSGDALGCEIFPFDFVGSDAE